MIFSPELFEHAEKILCKSSLSDFIKKFWHYADPAEYVHGWHTDVICEHLQAVLDGQIRNLIINIPFRHQKSLTVSVFFPAFAWTKKPELQFLYASYSQALSRRDSIKCRQIIRSPLYQKWFGDVFKIRDDQDTKENFKNDKHGYRIATSVDGMSTGEGGDIIILDDPNNMKKIFSKAYRESTNNFYDYSWSSRLNDPKKSAKIIVQQRGHQYDLTGHVMQQEDWDILCLPAVFESKHPIRSKTALNFTDPRKDGDILWPERFPLAEIEKYRNILGTWGASGQLQQRPAPVEGGIVKADWIYRFTYDTFPEKFVQVIQSWDTAMKADDAHDYSVCTTWGCTKDTFFLIHVFRKRLEFPDLFESVKSQYEAFKHLGINTILIEDKSSGISLIPEIRRRTDMPVRAFKPAHTDKATRLFLESPAFENGRVRLPVKAPWFDDYIEEIINFPSVPHDDQVDSTSQFLCYMRIAPAPAAGVIPVSDESKGDDDLFNGNDLLSGGDDSYLVN